MITGGLIASRARQLDDIDHRSPIEFVDLIRACPTRSLYLTKMERCDCISGSTNKFSIPHYALYNITNIILFQILSYVRDRLKWDRMRIS